MGWWLEEAGRVESLPPLSTSLEADVVVIGGGYTGMWSAWHVLQADPSARVVLLESGLCGHGPSGRNGGFCESMWLAAHSLKERFGAAPARALLDAASRSVTEIGDWCEENGVDAWFRPVRLHVRLDRARLRRRRPRRRCAPRPSWERPRPSRS